MNAAVSSWRRWGSTIGRCLKIVFFFFSTLSSCCSVQTRCNNTFNGAEHDGNFGRMLRLMHKTWRVKHRFWFCCQEGKFCLTTEC